MIKYYTRACNFYYGKISRHLVKNKLSLPLCGNTSISFDKLEIYKRENKKVTANIISLKQVKNQKPFLKIKINKDLKKITSNRNLFNKTTIMGILNMTPDSFSDGGLFNKKNDALKRIEKMIKAGATIVDIGGESTRPGSKVVNPNSEWIRVKEIIKKFKKKFPKVLLSVDTRKSLIMRNSINYKADIINDVSGFEFDPLSIRTVSKKKCLESFTSYARDSANYANKPKIFKYSIRYL